MNRRDLPLPSPGIFRKRNRCTKLRSFLIRLSPSLETTQPRFDCEDFKVPIKRISQSSSPSRPNSQTELFLSGILEWYTTVPPRCTTENRTSSLTIVVESLSVSSVTPKRPSQVIHIPSSLPLFSGQVDRMVRTDFKRALELEPWNTALLYKLDEAQKRL